MITEAPPLAGPGSQRASEPPVARPRIGIHGPASMDLLAAFAVVGMETVGAADAGPLDARVALAADLPALGDLVARGVPVVADADAKDFPRITSLLRLGIADVVMRPIVPAAVVGKVKRTLRRGR